VIDGDLRSVPQALRGTFGLAVSNPPFFDSAAGRPCLDDERAIARHDAMATPSDVARGLKAALKSNGVACAVFPAKRLAELIAAWSTEKLVPTRLRLVHPRESQQATVVLVEGRPGAKRPLIVEPPLFVHDEAGGYRDEVARLLAPGGCLARTGSVS
jgi:tRNA1(Val) A37 N6-methylase TrmN6